ncbi:MAG: hypothetical protein AAB425_09575, partial [Bdellovibrionota bacterium]
LLALPACIENGTFATSEGGSSSSGSSDIITSLSALSTSSNSSSSTDDGAKGSCASIDSSNPERQYCIDCYSTLLATKCPGIADPADCKDKEIAEGFTELVNVCVNASMKAGFTCTTACGEGYTLDSASCACVADSDGTASGTSGTDLIDRGQTDFGPPIVTAEWPSGSIIGVTISTSGYVGPTSCSVEMTGAQAFWMGVRNRAGTLAQNNRYGTPVVSSTTCTSNVVSPTYATSTGLAPVGTNVYATLRFGTNGTTSVSGAAGGGIGWVKAVHAGQGGVNMSPSPIPGATGTMSVSQSLEGPRFMARDQFGNIFFTSGDGDPSDYYGDVVAVLCLNVNPTGNPFCSDKVKGSIYVLAIAGVTALYKYSDSTLSASLIGQPYGVAVDSMENVFFTDRSKNMIALICGSTASGFCSGKTQGRVYIVANETQTAGSTDHATDMATSTFSAPMGIDVKNLGDNFIAYVADSGNGKVRVLCNKQDTGACSGITAKTTTTLASPTLSSPSDVKINWNGNLFIADTGNHQIVAKCYSATGGDLCQTGGKTSATVAGQSITIIGQAGISGDTGDGAPVIYAKTVKPYALAITKKYADDVSVTITTANFRDNNLAFTEALYVPTNSDSGGGNVIRMVCGSPYTNGDNIANVGFCRGVNAGTVIRLSGKSGVAAASSNNMPASSATAVSLTGLSYDLNKNLFFGTGYCGAPACSTTIYENGIRAVLYAGYEYDTTNKRDRACGIKYSFIDSNQQQSYYCLQLQAQTQCLFETCECAPVPVNNSVSAFWSSSTSSASCPTY